MPNKDFYFIVLRELAKNGLLKTTNLSKVTSEYLSDQSNVLDPIWTDVDRAVKEIFLEFLKNKHIKSYVDNTPLNLKFLSDKSYLPKIKVYAELTLEGYTFYNEHKKNETTLKYAFFALLISVFSLGATLYNTVKEYISKIGENKIERLQPKKTAPPLKKTILLFPITSPADSFHKHPTSASNN